jgi:hypothetical protein
MIRYLILASCLALVFPACGSDEGTKDSKDGGSDSAKTDGGGSGGGSLDNGAGSAQATEGQTPETLGRSRCELYFTCKCVDLEYTDEAACIKAETASAKEDLDAAKEAGLTFDGACVADVLANRADLGCKTTSEVAEADLPCRPCSIYHGAVPLGGACMATGSYSDCAQDLECIDFVCVESCKPVAAEGEACEDSEGAVTAKCVHGLFCASSSHACEKKPALGEPCPDAICAAGAHCDSMDSEACEALKADGEACNWDHECAKSSYCKKVGESDEVCTARLDDGEACTEDDAGVCKSGHCSEEKCSPEPAFMCD